MQDASRPPAADYGHHLDTEESPLFFHVKELQYDASPDRPEPLGPQPVLNLAPPYVHNTPLPGQAAMSPVPRDA